MGVYFKDMKIPTNCDLCPLHERYTTEVGCKITGSRYAVSGIPFASYQMENCPAQEIQTPHGKLIDIDVILSQLREMSLDDLSLAEDLIEHGIDDVLDDAPTIIEAEE